LVCKASRPVPNQRPPIACTASGGEAAAAPSSKVLAELRVRILIVLAILLVALLAAAFAFMPRGESGGFAMAFGGGGGDAVEVRFEPVRRGTLIERVAAPGEVQPNTKVDISAEVSARILELPHREGADVRAGDLVVRLDDSDLRARLEAAKARREAERFRLEAEQARLAGPTASLENARSLLRRQEALFASGDVSRQSLEDAMNRVAELEATVAAAVRSISVLESGVAAAAAEIGQVEEAIAKTVIRSPIDGTVTRLNAEVGELVVVGTMNNAGTVILTVADLSRMRLDARVAESDVARVRPGQPAEVRINAYPDRVFPGVVERVALQRSSDRDGSGYFKVEVMLQLEGERIFSGLAANVDIEVAEREGLIVPSQAIVDRDQDQLPAEVRQSSRLVDPRRRAISVVFVARDGMASAQPVRVGASNLVDTIVLEGLAEGEEIVVGPYKALESLEHGKRVAARPDAAASPPPSEASQAGGA
jgi:HlyD family secretion protein